MLKNLSHSQTAQFSDDVLRRIFEYKTSSKPVSFGSEHVRSVYVQISKVGSKPNIQKQNHFIQIFKAQTSESQTCRKPNQ